VFGVAFKKPEFQACKIIFRLALLYCLRAFFGLVESVGSVCNFGVNRLLVLQLAGAGGLL